MSVHARAGKLADATTLTNIPRLVAAYYALAPDAAVPAQRVSFGTSGHRGSSLDCAFNEAHIVAITQAICSWRVRSAIDGPLFIGIDTHALSECAATTALEVLVGNGVAVMVDDRDGYTPTPVVSHAILRWNREHATGRADGIVITPSHNPPEDGGLKYNPPNGGAADSATTTWIQNEANRLLMDAAHTPGGLDRVVKRMPLARARAAATTQRYDYMSSYIDDLGAVIDFDKVRATNLRLGVDPLGGAGVMYWGEIADRYGIPIEVVSTDVDPAFSFMTLDWDGRIRMDPSSRYAMQRLIGWQSRFDVAWASDPDHDRHGIVSHSHGLMNPNAYLAVAIEYLCRSRAAWPGHAGVGKTVVSSTMIDRVVYRLGRRLVEVPVGFKWFVDGLHDGSLVFGGEESAGASFVRRDGRAWTTDKDGIIMGLLAAEITAASGRDPGELYAQMESELGHFVYERIDAPADAAQKAALSRLSQDAVTATALAGDEITAKLTVAPGNGAAIGGLKVVTERGWFAARPSGTEDVYKLYAESSAGGDHLARIQQEAKDIIQHAFDTASAP